MYKKQLRMFKLGYWLMTMKMRLKMKKRSHRYDINRPRPRNGHKFTKCKMCQYNDDQTH